ncbi:AzlC family ABC transporter permease [Frankia sp. CcWB3]
MRSSPPGVSQEAAFPMREIAAGFRATIPLAMGVAAYGLAMGAVAPTRDITLVQLLIMDAVVLAGSAQIVVVGLWGIPVPLAAILASTLIINLRYILLCASLREVFVGRPLWQKLLGIHLVADENWAVTLAEGRRGGERRRRVSCWAAAWRSWCSGWSVAAPGTCSAGGFRHRSDSASTSRSPRPSSR